MKSGSSSDSLWLSVSFDSLGLIATKHLGGESQLLKLPAERLRTKREQTKLKRTSILVEVLKNSVIALKRRQETPKLREGILRALTLLPTESDFWSTSDDCIMLYPRKARTKLYVADDIASPFLLNTSTSCDALTLPCVH